MFRAFVIDVYSRAWSADRQMRADTALAESVVDTIEIELIRARVWQTAASSGWRSSATSAGFNDARLHESLGDLNLRRIRGRDAPRDETATPTVKI